MGTNSKTHLRSKKTIFRKNCSEVMLWNYLKMIQEKDYSYMVKSGRIPSKEILIEKYDKINQEFANLRGEENMINKFDLISYKEELDLKCKFGLVLIDTIQKRVTLNTIAIGNFEALIQELEDWDFVINKEIPLIDALRDVKSEIDALQTTIESLNEQIYPSTEIVEESEEKEANSALSFEKMLLVYQRVLNIGKINPKKTSLVAFAALELEVKEVIKNNKKSVE